MSDAAPIGRPPTLRRLIYNAFLSATGPLTIQIIAKRIGRTRTDVRAAMEVLSDSRAVVRLTAVPPCLWTAFGPFAGDWRTTTAEELEGLVRNIGFAVDHWTMERERTNKRIAVAASTLSRVKTEADRLALIDEGFAPADDDV